jgi:hypothetical protein
MDNQDQHSSPFQSRFEPFQEPSHSIDDDIIVNVRFNDAPTINIKMLPSATLSDLQRKIIEKRALSPNTLCTMELLKNGRTLNDCTVKLGTLANNNRQINLEAFIPSRISKLCEELSYTFKGIHPCMAWFLLMTGPFIGAGIDCLVYGIWPVATWHPIYRSLFGYS